MAAKKQTTVVDLIEGLQTRFGTPPPALAAAALGPILECVTGACPHSPPQAGTPVMAFRARAAADPFDVLIHHPGLSLTDIGILRGILCAGPR
jgi:hypothetical protein